MKNDQSAASPASEASRITVYVRAAVCLVVGLAAGYLTRGSLSPASAARSAVSVGQISVPNLIDVANSTTIGALKQFPRAPSASIKSGRMPTLTDMKQMADTQAAPMLEKLKTDPNNSVLLSQVAATYHTTHQFKQAADYYERAVKEDPKNVALRTRFASSLYRSGDVDGAITQLNQALVYDPKDANSLFDLGMIRLKGKRDGKGALAAWQRLLNANPQLSEDRRATVQSLMAAVLTMLSDQKGIQGAQANDRQKSNLN